MSQSDDETTTRPDGGSDVVLRRSFAEPPEQIWAMLTVSDDLARWAGTYTGAGVPGGTVELTITAEVDAGGEVAPPVTATIHECEAPRRLVVDLPEGPDSSWVIALTLSADPDGGTRLVFKQTVTDGTAVADIAKGWRWYLARLEAALGGHPMPPWE